MRHSVGDATRYKRLIVRSRRAENGPITTESPPRRYLYFVSECSLPGDASYSVQVPLSGRAKPPRPSYLGLGGPTQKHFPEISCPAPASQGAPKSPPHPPIVREYPLGTCHWICGRAPDRDSRVPIGPMAAVPALAPQAAAHNLRWRLSPSGTSVAPSGALDGGASSGHSHAPDHGASPPSPPPHPTARRMGPRGEMSRLSGQYMPCHPCPSQSPLC